MYTEKEKVLADAPAMLNKPDQPWEVAVENDCIVARWKWMDATFFSPGKVSSEAKNYVFTVTLKDNGKWKELDKVASTSGSLSAGGAKISASGFVGKSSQKSIEIGFGKNKQSEDSGIIGFRLDTSIVKKPIRDYLKACGWKKAGLF